MLALFKRGIRFMKVLCIIHRLFSITLNDIMIKIVSSLFYKTRLHLATFWLGSAMLLSRSFMQNVTEKLCFVSKSLILMNDSWDCIFIISLIIYVQVFSQMTLMRWVCFKVSQHHSDSFEKVFFHRLHSALLLRFCFAQHKNQMVIDIADSLCCDCINEWITLDFSFDVNVLCINDSGVKSRFTAAFSVIVCLALCLCTEGYWKNNCASVWWTGEVFTSVREKSAPNRCLRVVELSQTAIAREEISCSVYLDFRSRASSPGISPRILSPR